MKGKCELSANETRSFGKDFHWIEGDWRISRWIFKTNETLTATWSSFRMAWLLPVPQYAIAIVYMPLRRKTGSLSVDKLVTKASLSSKRLNIVKAMPTAKPRRIFSCWVSWAYWQTSWERKLVNYERNRRSARLKCSYPISLFKAARLFYFSSSSPSFMTYASNKVRQSWAKNIPTSIASHKALLEVSPMFIHARVIFGYVPSRVCQAAKT